MRKYMIGIVVGVLLASVVVVLAGNLDSPAAPGATSSYSLEDIYKRLDDGTAGSQSTFTEPSSGPGSTMHTLNDIMAKAPAVDGTNGASKADVANSKTFWGLTSGQWGLQTGTATLGNTYNAGVPKTGQTDCYKSASPWVTCTCGTANCPAGQDGDLEKGVAWPSPRFTDNNNGTVTHNLTGLIWLKDARCFPRGSWTDALSHANNLASGNCGLTDGSSAGDWRLPNVREIFSLIDFSQYDPALPSNHPFTNVLSIHYWTSTTIANGTSNAWSVDLENGDVFDGVAFLPYTWPVRGGQ